MMSASVFLARNWRLIGKNEIKAGLTRYTGMRIFVTHICPKHKIIEYGFSLSMSYFNHNLIDGGGFDKGYSIYPGNKNGHFDCLDDGSFEAVYSSWRLKRRWMCKLARFKEQFRVFRKIPKNAKVWYYNLSTLNILLILLLRLFKPSVQQNIIILDYTPDVRFNKMVLPLINRMHGRISLSNYTKFEQRNLVCMPGVVPVVNNPHARVTEIKKEFLLSGALKENITMLGMVLDAFAEMPECTLHVSGILIDHKDKMMEYAAKYPNIIFHGKLPYDEFQALLENTPFSLNTRKPSASENLCNFPSKVIEALLNNRIILSTIEYKQLEGMRYLKIGAQKESLKSDIRNILSMPECELLEYANQQQIAFDMFNAIRWNETMTRIELQK